MRTALITGVAGQDGAYLSRLLTGQGTRVVGLKLPGPIEPDLAPFLEGVELVDGDLTDTLSLRSMLETHRPDEIYNLAGISSVARSWDQPVLTAQVNAVAVVGLLELVRELSEPGWTPRLLQPSSAEIFGQPAETPQRESTPLAPRSPYGLAKAFAHQAVQLAREAHGLHASTVILYNHESPLRPASFVTRKVTRAVAAISLGLQDELVLGDLGVSRDWGFAGDYVEAMVRAVRHPVPGDYVVATGVQHSLRDLIDTAFHRVGIDDWKRYVRSDPAFIRPAEISAMVGDASRARSELGWTPVTTFEDLVHLMVDADLEELRSSATGRP